MRLMAIVAPLYGYWDENGWVAFGIHIAGSLNDGYHKCAARITTELIEVM